MEGDRGGGDGRGENMEMVIPITCIRIRFLYGTKIKVSEFVLLFFSICFHIRIRIKINIYKTIKKLYIINDIICNMYLPKVFKSNHG